jgi:hypothetical protein
LAFTPDCRYFVYGLNSGELAIYDLSERKEPLTVPAHRGDVRSLAFSSDGARLASGGADSTSLIWDFSALVKHMKESKIGQHAQELLQDWNDLAADNGIRANAAIWRLAQSPDKALALLRDKFKPPQKPEPAQIEQWIRDLDHARFAVRESASKSLAEIGEEAREQLKQALKKGPAAEANRRITALLKSLGEPRVPRQLRPMRAVEVLEHIGSVEARQLLVEIGKQTTDGEVKREIDFTLERWLKK